MAITFTKVVIFLHIFPLAAYIKCRSKSTGVCKKSLGGDEAIEHKERRMGWNS